jgi:hypothetical protein
VKLDACGTSYLACYGGNGVFFNKDCIGGETFPFESFFRHYYVIIVTTLRVKNYDIDVEDYFENCFKFSMIKFNLWRMVYWPLQLRQ